MCLGVPGRIVEWIDRDPLFARAYVEFEGTAMTCHMACVPEAEVGEYVIVHAGVAIALIEASEAYRILDELRRLDHEESEASNSTPPSTGGQA